MKKHDKLNTNPQRRNRNKEEEKSDAWNKKYDTSIKKSQKYTKKEEEN